MRNQEAATVAKILVDRIFCVHGCPLQILSDQRPNFESSLFREICRLLAVDKVRTSPYKPSTNGNIERFHATMHNMLAKLVSEKPERLGSAPHCHSFRLPIVHPGIHWVHAVLFDVRPRRPHSRRPCIRFTPREPPKQRHTSLRRGAT